MLAGFWEDLSLQINLSSSTDFFLKGIHFRKYAKFGHRENKKVWRSSIPGHLKGKVSTFWQIFDDSNICTKQCYHSQEWVSLFSVWKQPLKGVPKTERKMPCWAHFEEFKLHEKWFPSHSFPCKFSKSFQKTSNCCIVVEIN